MVLNQNIVSFNNDSSSTMSFSFRKSVNDFELDIRSNIEKLKVSADKFKFN